MRSMIYQIAISLDGFIAQKDGSVNGFLMDGPHAEDFVHTLSLFDTVVMGRSTYEFGYAFGLQLGDLPYPGLINVVCSRSLTIPAPSQVLLTDNALPFLQNLKAKAGKPIWLCGGGKLAGELMHHQMIDELWLKLNPVTFGEGIPLFEHGFKCDLWALKDSKVYSNGVILLKYSRAKHQV